jgi:transcriptional regulator with XRE-family HTH domain
MSQIELLVTELKRNLRAQGLTYRDVAGRLQVSESSVKRVFSRRSFSLARFEQICNVAGLNISDLVELMDSKRVAISELTVDQERTLVSDPKLLLMAYLLITGWSVEQICANFKIAESESEGLLIHLHRARIIELLPLNRVRLLTSRNFKWRKNGPIQRLFREQVQREFFDSTFSEDGARLRFVGGPLSSAGLAQMQKTLDRVTDEFNELSRKDAALPLAERHGCSAVFAIRPWEFSMFEKLRRTHD